MGILSAMTEVEPAWPDAVRVACGDVHVDLAPEGLRHLVVAGCEVAANLYPAVRATDWSTVPSRLLTQQVRLADPDAVAITREEVLGEQLCSRLSLVASPTGRFEASVELTALADCELNRWGFNICLDAESYAGSAVPSVGADARLPVPVAPQLVVDGVTQGLFPPAPELDVRRPDGARVRISSEGLLLEAEDQRNWTDPTFKIYSGSLREPRPIRVRRGEVLRQRLVIQVVDLPPAAPADAPAADPTRITVEAARELPLIGVQANDLAAADLPAARRLLDLLAVDHARVDVEPEAGLGPPAVPVLGVPVELAVLLSDASAETREVVADVAKSLPAGSRLLVHLDSRRTTDRALADRVRELAGAGVDVTPGTDAYFTDLNRDRPDVRDGSISFSINPTVHLEATEEIFATLPIQQLLVREAHRLFAADVVVSPVTLRLRGDPEAAAADRSARHVIANRHVDARLRAIEGAAWTVGSVHALLSGGVMSATWHELIGPRGLADTHHDRVQLSAAFHVLAALRARERPLVQPLRAARGGVVGLWFAADAGSPGGTDGGRLLLASLRPWPQRVELPAPLPAGWVRSRLRTADVTACAATSDWWAAREEPWTELGEVELDPFEVTQFRQPRPAPTA